MAADSYSSDYGDYGMPDMSNGSQGPTGIPDPNHPGYDTAGYPLSGGGTVAPPITGGSWAAGTPQANGVTPTFTPAPGSNPTPITNSAGQVWGGGGPNGAFDTTGAPMSFAKATDTGGSDGSGGGGLVDPYTGPAPSFITAPTFTPPAFKQAPAFQLPSGQDVLNGDPSYGFRLQQGEQALQNSAAAGGVLNTGNTLKDILGYGQNFASQEYDKAVNRAKDVYNTNYQTQYVDPYKASYQSALDTFSPQMANWSAANGFNWNNYLQNYDMFRNRQLDSVNAATQLA